MARSAPALFVFDGSNLATEGLVAPSLDQLREAVQSLQDEHPKAKIVVVVDATFEHRVATKDRKAVKEAELSGELVAPPAGTIGRGDAFVLAIAQRTKGTVVSNDSFQEFQADHSWLFDDGRLIGGKPVPHVGWVFT
ncbi:MAG: Hsp70 family protein, partial [Actinobacteria bacterium]|nr:Hsp70 family protein [Actinomycetota bacterium]